MPPASVSIPRSVRSRLLIAFIAISLFSLVAALLGVWSLTQVDRSLRIVTDVRVPQALTLTDLSRQAERILTAAPALLVVTSEGAHTEVSATVRAEAEELRRLIGKVDAQSMPSRLVDDLYNNLLSLDGLVERRLATTEKRVELTRKLANATSGATRLVLPAERMLKGHLSQWFTFEAGSAERLTDAQGDLALDIIGLLPQIDVLAKIDDVHGELLKVASASSAEEIDVRGFAVARAIEELEAVASAVPANVRQRQMRLQRHIASLKELSVGESSLGSVRKRELALLEAGEELLEENARLSASLSDSIRVIVGEAKATIDEARQQAIDVREVNTRILIIVGLTSVLCSMLIVWLYVSRNLIERLQALSTSMLSIAGGDLKAPLPSPGTDDEIGRMAEVLSVFRDTAVEVRESNLAEIETARRTLQDAIENTSEGFALYDADDRLVICNSRYREIMLGDAGAELPEGTSLEGVVRAAAGSGRFPDSERDPESWIERELVRLKRSTDPFIQALAGNHWQQVSVRHTVQAGIVIVQSDITEIMRISDEVKRAKDAAEAANEAKSTFLATMSHEVRTPLNGIIGMSKLMSGTALSAEQRDFSATINEAAETLLTIINDILDFSKVEAGALELECIPIDLVDTIEGAAELLSSRAGEKGIELSCRIGRDVPQCVLGDAVRLRQILLNLLNNAIKFTDEGEVIMAADVANRDDFGAIWVEFRISDTGIGIPPERMDRLFKSFSQIDASTTRRYGGTGLGLIITKRLVELMGGEIMVLSEAGKGTTFAFALPVEIAMLEDQAAREAQLELIRSSRVLLVDGDRTNLQILAERLRAWNLRPEPVESPAGALSLLRNGQSFDAAIVDYRMPQMSGLELARQIRETREGRVLPIILLSRVSLIEPEIRRQVDACDFAAVLMKPTRSAQLLTALTRAVRPDASAPSTSEPQGASEHEVSVDELRVLLVDDNAINRKVARKILVRLGYEPVVVSSAAEAIAACRSAVFDVILMDIEMPEMDGVTATRAIRRLVPAERMPYLVALTANAMASERESYLRSGMDDYLSKPVEIDALAVCLAAATAHCIRRSGGAIATASRVDREDGGATNND